MGVAAKKSGLGTLLVIALALGLVVLLIEELSRPFAISFGVATAAALYLAIRRKGATRVVAYNLGVAFLGLALVEGFYIRDARRVDCEPELSDPHEVLGYAPLPDRRVACRTTQRRETIYDAVYSIGASGWRIAPPTYGEPQGCVLFFGGSFTFGQGVDDEEALPYRVGVESEGRYSIYNFAFKGYGPHQMLAALEGGWVVDQIACDPTHVIYQAIPTHVRRVVGLTSWGSHAPKYRLEPGGGVSRAGRFDDSQSAARKFLERRLLRSALITRFRNTLKPDEPEHLELFYRVVATSKREVAQHFPGAEFHMLLWDQGADELAKNLAARDIEVHRVSEILPELEKNGDQYRLHKKDAHPNAKAHALIARYVVKKILLTRTRP